MKIDDVKAFFAKLKAKYDEKSNLIAFFFYAILAAVVIYGIPKGVYDGFAAPVPFIIILIFVVMAFIRLYSWINKSKPSENSDEENQKENQ